MPKKFPNTCVHCQSTWWGDTPHPTECPTCGHRNPTYKMSEDARIKQLEAKNLDLELRLENALLLLDKYNDYRREFVACHND